MPTQLTAIDLFSGAGGLSLGLKDAGYRVLFASDIDEACAQTHQKNFPETYFHLGSIRDLAATEVTKVTGLSEGELDLMIGGPPCQGFSIIGARQADDERNNLFREFFRIGEALRPKCMVIENVPGLATMQGGRVLQEILNGFSALGYRVGFAELLAAQYGVPQMRWRMVFVAFREDLGIDPRSGFPVPTHGSQGIGALVPNRTIAPAEMVGFVTTRDAIGDLPPVEPGQTGYRYTSTPFSPYQQEMRAGLKDELFNHYAPKLSEQNLARLRALKPGQDWRDLPYDLLPDGMRRAKRKDHTRRYSRMTWEGIPRSIITRFRDPKSGEYTHPSQHRTISIREAARIQSFPDRFVFLGSNTQQYDQVGNAVPPKLAKAIGQVVAACLRGEVLPRIPNPFLRRPSFSQAQLLFDPA